MAWTVTDVTTGVDITNEIDAAATSIAQRAYAETSRFSTRVIDESATITIAEEHEILVMDGAAKAFAGYVRTCEKTDQGSSGQRVYVIECQDYTTALGDDIADSGSAVRANGESDKARIAALGTAFGTRGLNFGSASVVQLRAVMPDQDFTGLTLHECLTEICKITGGSFYVDYDKVVHYFASEALSAPFGVSDAPNGSTTQGMSGFRMRTDSTQYVNAVFVIGTGISGWRYLGGSPPTAGTRRAMTIRDESVIDATTLNAVGDAALATYGSARQPSEFTTYTPGLRAGMNVQVTHAGWSISAVTYRIASIEARPVDKDRFSYQVFIGSNPISLGELMRQTNANVAAAIATATAQADALLDLSAGGGNLVPNSSFEDGTYWTVGGSWAIGVAAGDAFNGAKEARYTPSGSSAALSTGFITVDRLAEYWASAWIFCRAFTSGRLRMLVEEYNASSTLLATTIVGEVAAVGSGWQRLSRKFIPSTGVNMTTWQATTTKVKIVFSPNGVNATGTWSVDGVQLERGGIITAYAPAPYEIVDGTITTTEIADNAITSPKLIAGAVVAGKIAAGAVGATEIVSGAITTSHFAAGAAAPNVANAPNTVVIDSTGISIFAGKLSIEDEYGVAGAVTGKGFGGSWLRFLVSRIYNSDFKYGQATDIVPTIVGTASTVADYNASVTSALPHWIARLSGTLLTVATDATAPSGKCLQSQASGVQTSEVLQDIAIEPGRHYRVTYLGKISAGATGGISLYGSWRTVNHAIIGSEVFLGNPASGAAAGTSYSLGSITTEAALPVAPANAAYLRLVIRFGHLGSGTFAVATIAIEPTPYMIAERYKANTPLSDLTLTTSATQLQGVNVAIDAPSLAIVRAVWDFSVTTGGVGTCVGEILTVDPSSTNVTLPQQALFGPPSASTGRATIERTYEVDMDEPGTWGVSTLARKSSAGGAAIATLVHSELRVDVKLK